MRSILDKILCTIFTAGLLFLPLTLAAGEVTTDRLWWAERDNGWFFYNEDIEIPITAEEEVRKKPQGSSGLFTERMERTGKELLSKAMENPTEETVKSYMEYNKAMLVISDDFTKVWQKVIMKYPHLLFSEGLTHAGKDIKKAIDSLKEKAGLYFVHSFSCQACRKQAAELKKFEDKYGMEVLAITIDGALPEYPDAMADNGIVSTLGVQNVPSIFIAIPSEKKIDLVSQGYIDSFELERRLYNYDKPIDTEQIETLLLNAGYGAVHGDNTGR